MGLRREAAGTHLEGVVGTHLEGEEETEEGEGMNSDEAVAAWRAAEALIHVTKGAVELPVQPRSAQSPLSPSIHAQRHFHTTPRLH